MVDMDEFVYAPNLLDRLQEAKDKHIAIIQPRGWQMLHKSFDFKYPGQIYDVIKRGFDSFWYYKAGILDPELIEESNFGIGCHTGTPLLRDFPRSNVWYADQSKIEMMHFKRINYHYYQNRIKRFTERHSAENKKRGWRQFPFDSTDKGVSKDYEDGEALACNVLESLDRPVQFASYTRFEIQNLRISKNINDR
jgi:hypothetical protein